MNNLQKLGFDNWFEDKVDLSKTDFNIVRVISVNKNSFNLCHGATPELSGQAVAAFKYNLQHSRTLFRKDLFSYFGIS